MRHVHFLLFVGLAIWFVTGTAPPSHGGTNAELSEALAQLRASDGEWRRSNDEFRSLRQNEEISGLAAEEFASFVADLQRKMLEDCHTFRKLGGDPEAMSFDCDLPEEQLASKPALPQSPTSVQTEEEKTAALDAALAESLGEFDETLQRNQTEIREQRESRSPGGGGFSDSGSNRTGGGAGGGFGSSPGSPLSQAGPKEPGAGPGVEKKEPTPIVVSDVDGKVGAGDDSVVARQLREAAEKETDPILKEKLWVEYRRYRASKADPN